MNADNTCPDSLSEKVLGAVFEVSNTLGVGFLEKVYQRALLRELSLRGIRAIADASLSVIYKGHSVGEYFADLLVEDALVVELKCAERLSNPRGSRIAMRVDAAGVHPLVAIRHCHVGHSGRARSIARTCGRSSARTASARRLTVTPSTNALSLGQLSKP